MGLRSVFFFLREDVGCGSAERQRRSRAALSTARLGVPRIGGPFRGDWEHSMTPHAWASGIIVEWPVGSKQDALKHLAALHYHVDLVDVSYILANTEFAGTECPICLEQWAHMAPDAPAVALPCGHGCCEACLDKCGVFAGAQLDCPVCRLPA